MSQAHAAWERLRLGGVDELAVLARAYLDAVGDARSVKVKLAGGRALEISTPAAFEAPPVGAGKGA